MPNDQYVLKGFLGGISVRAIKWTAYGLAGIVLAILAYFILSSDVVRALTQNAGNITSAIIVVALIVFVYVLPTLVALLNKHPAFVGIATLNLALGWTGIVWVATFIWAWIKPSQSVTIINQAPTAPTPTFNPPPLPVQNSVEKDLEAINRLLEKGLISAEEHASKRNSIIGRI